MRWSPEHGLVATPGLDAMVKHLVGQNTRFLIPDNCQEVFHYAPLENFFKIVDSKDLFLTHADNLDDTSEGQYAVELISVVIDEFRFGTHEQSSIFYDAKCGLNKHFSDKRILNNFVACFSLNPDSNALFKEYAGDHNGVAIGFSRNYPTPFLDSSGYPSGCSRVIYSVDEQKRILAHLIQDFGYQITYLLQNNDCEQVFNVGDSEVERKRKILATAGGLAFSALLGIAPFFKHPSFYHEEEVRYCYSFDTHCSDVEGPNIFDSSTRTSTKRIHDWHYRERQQAGKQNPLNYVFPITSVTIGPRVADTDEALIKDELNKNGFGNIIIRKSELPIRRGTSDTE